MRTQGCDILDLWRTSSQKFDKMFDICLYAHLEVSESNFHVAEFFFAGQYFVEKIGSGVGTATNDNYPARGCTLGSKYRKNPVEVTVRINATNVERPVLGSIEADFCTQMLVFMLKEF